MVKLTTFVSWSTISVLSVLGQRVLLPLFIASFQSDDGEFLTGPYFVIVWCSFLFNCVFWPLVVWGRKDISKRCWEFTCSRQHYKLFLIGFADALDAFLIVFSSSTNRVPGILQPILAQGIIPFTFIVSKLMLGKQYNSKQLLGSGLVGVGLIISLIPTFHEILSPSTSEGTQLQSGYAWPFIFLFGSLPIAFMNVLEELVFRKVPDYDINLLLAFESFWQSVIIAVFFFLDIVPGFGTSASLDEWLDRFKNGLECFFAPESSRCQICAVIGVSYALSYILSYFYNSKLMKEASANYASLLGSISCTLCVLFWIIFPSINSWSGGISYSSEDLVFTCSSLPFLFIGSYIFRVYESNSKADDYFLLSSTDLEVSEG